MLFKTANDLAHSAQALHSAKILLCSLWYEAGFPFNSIINLWEERIAARKLTDGSLCFSSSSRQQS